MTRSVFMFMQLLAFFFCWNEKKMEDKIIHFPSLWKYLDLILHFVGIFLLLTFFDKLFQKQCAQEKIWLIKILFRLHNLQYYEARSNGDCFSCRVNEYECHFLRLLMNGDRQSRRDFFFRKKTSGVQQSISMLT